MLIKLSTGGAAEEMDGVEKIFRAAGVTTAAGEEVVFGGGVVRFADDGVRGATGIGAGGTAGGPLSPPPV